MKESFPVLVSLTLCKNETITFLKTEMTTTTEYRWAAGERERVIAQCELGEHSPQASYLEMENDWAADEIRGFSCPNSFILKHIDGIIASSWDWDTVLTAANEYMRTHSPTWTARRISPSSMARPLEAILGDYDLTVAECVGIPDSLFWPNGRKIVWCVVAYGVAQSERWETSTEAYDYARKIKQKIVGVYPV